MRNIFGLKHGLMPSIMICHSYPAVMVGTVRSLTSCLLVKYSPVSVSFAQHVTAYADSFCETGEPDLTALNQFHETHARTDALDKLPLISSTSGHDGNQGHYKPSTSEVSSQKALDYTNRKPAGHQNSMGENIWSLLSHLKEKHSYFLTDN
jgi:hypothetical protein